MSQSKFTLRLAAASATLIAAPYAIGQETVPASAEAAANTASQVQAEAAAANQQVQAEASAAANAAADADATVTKPDVTKPDAAPVVNRAERTIDKANDRVESTSQMVQKRAEVLLRGPVHEAFARPNVGQIVHKEIAPKAPPAPLHEIAPAASEGMLQFVEGYWSFDKSASDFVWVTGTLRRAPQGAAWVAGQWHETAEGMIRTPGYWNVAADAQAEVNAQANAAAQTAATIDVPARKIETLEGMIDVPSYVDHPLHERGVLYAPMRIVDAKEVRIDSVRDRAQNVVSSRSSAAAAAIDNRQDALNDRAQNVRDRADGIANSTVDRADARLDRTSDRVDNARENVQDRAANVADSTNRRVDNVQDRASNVQDRVENRAANVKSDAEMRLENAEQRVANAREDVEDAAQSKVASTVDRAEALKTDARDTIDSANAQVDAAGNVAADAEASVVASSNSIAADASSSTMTMVDGMLTVQPTEQISTDSLMLHLFADQATDAFYFGDYYGDAGQALNLVHWSQTPAAPGTLLAQYDAMYSDQTGSFAERLSAWDKYFEANVTQRPAHTLEAAQNRLSDVSAAKQHQLSHLSQTVSDKAMGITDRAMNLDPAVNVDADLSGSVSAEVAPTRTSADTLQNLNAEVQAGRVTGTVQSAAGLNGAATPNVRVPVNAPRLPSPNVTAPNGALNGGLNGAGGVGAPGLGNAAGGLGGSVGGVLGK